MYIGRAMNTPNQGFSKMEKLSPEVTDEGAESNVMRIGAHSSVGFAATFSILEKAFARHFVCANRPTNQNLKDKLMFSGVFKF